MCSFCMQTVFQLYFYESGTSCDAFPSDFRVACQNVAADVGKQREVIESKMKEYVVEMGVGGGAQARVCREIGCCSPNINYWAYT